MLGDLSPGSPLLDLIQFYAHMLSWPEPYIYRYIRCIYRTFGRQITIHTVIYGVYIRFWPTLHICISQRVLCDSTRTCIRVAVGIGLLIYYCIIF